MEEQLKYYFYNNRIETATTEIRGWQQLNKEEIDNYLTGNYEVIFNVDKYELKLQQEVPFDLIQYKADVIRDLSALSLSVGEIVAPTYKFNNCLLSKFMVENNETPIYDNWLEIMNDFKNKRIALRNEFYRLKSLIEQALNKENIDILLTENLFLLCVENTDNTLR